MAARRRTRTAISDSLVMADLAVKMVESGCETIGVLGWISCRKTCARSSTRRATPRPRYRMAAEDIALLAEAAQSASYDAYLADAGKVKNAAAIYINTGLDTRRRPTRRFPPSRARHQRRRHRLKAAAQIPTCTCTTARTRTWVATWLSFATHDDVGRRGHQSHAPGDDRDTINRFAAIEIFRRRHAW